MWRCLPNGTAQWTRPHDCSSCHPYGECLRDVVHLRLDFSSQSKAKGIGGLYGTCKTMRKSERNTDEEHPCHPIVVSTFF